MALPPPGALQGIRVLDLAGPGGLYCGRLLAGLGAEVIRIEPPGGDESRRIGPYYEGEETQAGLKPAPTDPHLRPSPSVGRRAGGEGRGEDSLFHWHFNAGKLGITLDLESQAGASLLLRLAEGAQIVIETFRPGCLDRLGVAFEDLERINPAIVLVSITPFGQTGPFSQFEGGELIEQAAGGLLWMCGWPDRPPVMMGGWPAMHQASAEGAAAALLALYAAEDTGKGRHIDVSAQACLPMTLMTSMYDFYHTRARRQPRIGNHQARPLNGMFACKDGHVDFRFRGRPGQWERFVDWLDTAGKAGDLADARWRDHTYRDEPENTRHINGVFQRFLMNLTREEAMDLGQRAGYEVGAVYTAEDLLRDPQLEARDFWVDVEHPELGRALRYPGAPYALSETPWRLERRAPLLGEHNALVYGEMLGLAPDEIESFHVAGVV